MSARDLLRIAMGVALGLGLLSLVACEAAPTPLPEATSPPPAEGEASDAAPASGPGDDRADADADADPDLGTDTEVDAGAEARAAQDGDVGEVDLSAVDASWPTELYNGEAGPAKRGVLDGIRSGALPEEIAFAEGFRGEDFSARPLRDERPASHLRIGDWEPRDAGLDEAAFRERFDAYLAEFQEIEHLESHTWEIQLRPGPEGQRGIETVEALWIVGTQPDGQRREDRLEMVFDLVAEPVDAGTGEETSEEAASPWRIAGVRSREGRTVLAPDRAFVDVTDAWLEGGYDQAGAEIYTSGGPALADYDDDGDVDLFVPRMHAPMLLYENLGDGRMREVAEERGLFDLPTLEDSVAGAFADVDGDGDRDLLVLFQGRGLRSYLNEEGGFRDATGIAEAAGAGEWQGIALGDVDGDGLPDVYLSNYGLIDTTRQPESYVDARDGRPNVLLRGLGDGRFEDVTAEAGLDVDNQRWTYASAFADFDQDGDLDLYVANDYGPNHLFENDGSGGFADVTDALSANDQANGMGVSWLDVDNDLDLDIYVSNMQSFAGNRITRLEAFPGEAEQAELYRRFSQGNTLLRNDGDEGFVEASDEAGVKAAFWSWGSAPLDYDADGDLDVFGAAGFYTGASSADT